MPTSNGDRLPFGQDSLLPEGCLTAWGARLIVDQDGYVDFVPDRQGAAGEDRDAFFALLNERYSVPTLRDDVRALLSSGQMHTREG